MNDSKEIRDRIEREVKQTVGYKEAENKESFMVGVGVAISKMLDVYDPAIKELNRQVESFRHLYENTRDDLKTVAEIINRYSDNE